MMCSTEPWTTLGRTHDECLAVVSDPAREVWVAHEGGRVAGFAIVDMGGAFVGYLKIICVGAEFRGRGVGTELMHFIEERIFRDSPNVFLCVSSFNPRAKKLYESLGYEIVGEMPDYLVRGASEFLMRKSIAPMDEFRKRKRVVPSS